MNFSYRNFFLIFSCVSTMRGAAAASNSTRTRMNDYLVENQQFFVINPSVDVGLMLNADPDAEPIELSAVYWFCPPYKAPDQNGDGEYDSIVSHAILYLKNLNTWIPAGYHAVWAGEEMGYDEILVDYATGKTRKIFPEDESTGMARMGWFQLPTANNDFTGSVASAAGKWTCDLSDPLLADFVDMVGTNEGMEVTGESCQQLYRKYYDSEVKGEASSGGMKASEAIGSLTVVAASLLMMF